MVRKKGTIFSFSLILNSNGRVPKDTKKGPGKQLVGSLKITVLGTYKGGTYRGKNLWNWTL